MDQAAKAVAKALFDAIKAESDGYSFYKMAANAAEDEQGRRIFNQLAAEELEHKRFLTGQYRSVLETGQVDRSLKLGRQADLSGVSPIFSDSIRSRLREAHMEMSALSIGIQLEQGAMRYYRQQAEQSSDPEVVRLFEELAAWEKGHYDALLRQQDALRDDYWSEGGFAPF